MQWPYFKIYLKQNLFAHDSLWFPQKYMINRNDSSIPCIGMKTALLFHWRRYRFTYA